MPIAAKPQLAALSVWLLSTVACAQTLDLPKELAGRWSIERPRVSQTFSLEEIQAVGTEGFKARLTWWTTDPRCAVRGAPIEGKASADTLEFSLKTACDIPASVQLKRGASGWAGRGEAQGNNGPLQLLLEAK